MKIIKCMLAGLFCVSQVLAFEVIKDERAVRIGTAGKDVLEYRFGEVPFKPYVAQLCTPAGVPVLRDSPSDHKHHHSLMFAVEAAGVDFWTEQPNCGKQLGAQFDLGSNSLTHRLEWRTPAGKQVLTEARTITLDESKDVTLVTWCSRLQTPSDTNKVTLTGSHFFGLGMRFVTNMDVVATFMNATGKTGDVVRGTERLIATSWCACSGPVSGKLVTAVLFDHPSNVRYPSRMFTMTKPFTYLSATLNLWKEPYILKAGNPLDLCYGIALWDGHVSREQIEKTYRIWLLSVEAFAAP